jgi:hypothetical protein
VYSKENQDFDFTAMRHRFDPETVLHVLRLVRTPRNVLLSNGYDQVSSNLVENVTEFLIKANTGKSANPIRREDNVRYRPDKEIKFIAKSNTQIKFHNANRYENIPIKLKTLLLSLGATIIECDGTLDHERVTRRDTYFDSDSLLANSMQSVTVRTYMTDKPRLPTLTVKQSEVSTRLGSLSYLDRKQYRAEISQSSSAKLLGKGLNKLTLRKLFQDIDLGINATKRLYPIGEALIRRALIRFELERQVYRLYVDKYYFHELDTDRYSETFTEIEIDCSEAKGQNKTLNSFLGVIESILELEPQAMSKFQRFNKFRLEDESQDYYYFVGVELVVGYYMSAETQKQLVQRFHKIIKDSVGAIVDDREALMIPMGGNVIIGLRCDWGQVERVVKHIRLAIEQNNREDFKRRIKYKIAVHFGSIFKFTALDEDMSVMGDGIEVITDVLEKSGTDKFFVSEQAFKKISETQVISTKSEKSFEIKPNGHGFAVYEYSLDE